VLVDYSTFELASSIPAQPLITGHPPRGLTARVRYFGQPEALVEAYMQVRRNG
jgi:hypothetical protein